MMNVFSFHDLIYIVLRYCTTDTMIAFKFARHIHIHLTYDSYKGW